MSNVSLWLVEIDEADWDYDRFECAVVWAASAEQAEQIVRAAVHLPAAEHTWLQKDQLWVEKDTWRLHVRPAPSEGVALIHWHAG